MFVYKLCGCGFESRYCHSFQTFGVVYLCFSLVVILSWIHDLNLILVTTSQFDMFKISNINTRTMFTVNNKDTRRTSLVFFLYRGFFHRHWRFTGQQGKGGDNLLLHSSTSTRSRTLRHLFATLHVRWLSHIFNRNACVYQAITRWDLPPYRVTIWLIDDDAMFVCLLDELILGFLLQQFDMGNRWIWTRIDYHPWHWLSSLMSFYCLYC